VAFTNRPRSSAAKASRFAIRSSSGSPRVRSHRPSGRITSLAPRAVRALGRTFDIGDRREHDRPRRRATPHEARDRARRSSPRRRVTIERFHAQMYRAPQVSRRRGPRHRIPTCNSRRAASALRVPQRRTAPSTHPPDTEPATSPSSAHGHRRARVSWPDPFYADFTRAIATRRPAACHRSMSASLPSSSHHLGARGYWAEQPRSARTAGAASIRTTSARTPSC